MQEDLYYPHPLIQDLMWDGLYILIEPLLMHWPFNKLVREKALQKTMKHIHYEDENSRYITIGCVEKVSFSHLTDNLEGKTRKWKILIRLLLSWEMKISKRRN